MAGVQPGETVVIYGGGPAYDPQGHEHPDATLNNLVKSVRFSGSIGVVGVYVPQDPGGTDDLAKQERGSLRLRAVLVQGPGDG
jgi:threonine dehydrogenase-like Zn-dependent dehydrogenase